MAKVINNAKNADGMLDILKDKNDLNLSAFDDVPYNPDDFGGKFIKEARKKQRLEGHDIEDSPLIYKGDD
jgi:hypothetical protein